MKKLIIFDIDGTLIHKSAFEDHIYLNAVHQTLGDIEVSTDWDSYQYCTDAGAFFEVVNKAFSRSPSLDEKAQMEMHFAHHLHEVLTHHRDHYQALSGAQEIFEEIKAIGWDTAIATGCWKTSAMRKLDHAKIAYQNIPMANSNDAYARKEIIEVAIARAKEHYCQPHYAHIIYVGDRIVDFRAAQQLGIGFVGIGELWQTLANNAFFYTLDYTDTARSLITYLQALNEQKNNSALKKTEEKGMEKGI